MKKRVKLNTLRMGQKFTIVGGEDTYMAAVYIVDDNMMEAWKSGQHTLVCNFDSGSISFMHNDTEVEVDNPTIKPQDAEVGVLYEYDDGSGFVVRMKDGTFLTYGHNCGVFTGIHEKSICGNLMEKAE